MDEVRKDWPLLEKRVVTDLLTGDVIDTMLFKDGAPVTGVPTDAAPPVNPLGKPTNPNKATSAPRGGQPYHKKNLEKAQNEKEKKKVTFDPSFDPENPPQAPLVPGQSSGGADAGAPSTPVTPAPVAPSAACLAFLH